MSLPASLRSFHALASLDLSGQGCARFLGANTQASALTQLGLERTNQLLAAVTKLCEVELLFVGRHLRDFVGGDLECQALGRWPGFLTCNIGLSNCAVSLCADFAGAAMHSALTHVAFLTACSAVCLYFASAVAKLRALLRRRSARPDLANSVVQKLLLG